MWRKENPHALLVGMQTGAATVESSMEMPQKIKNGTQFHFYDPAIPLLSIYLKELKMLILCTPMFITALFIIAKIWKQPKRPSVAEWIRMEYYSAIKKRKSYPL